MEPEFASPFSRDPEIEFYPDPFDYGPQPE
jgi:hypothetical protein